MITNRKHAFGTSILFGVLLGIVAAPYASASIGQVEDTIRQFFGAPVNAAGAADGEVLSFQASSGTWVAAAGGAGPLVTGDLAEVLTIGSVTGGTDLTVSTGDAIFFDAPAAGDVYLQGETGANGQLDINATKGGFGDGYAVAKAFWHTDNDVAIGDPTTSNLGLRMGSDNPISWSSTTGLSGTLDTWIERTSTGKVEINSTLGGGGNGSLASSDLKAGSPASTPATGDLAAGDGTNELFWDASVGSISQWVGTSEAIPSNTFWWLTRDDNINVRIRTSSAALASTQAALVLGRSRGTQAVPADVINDDQLGSLSFKAYISNNWRTVAQITALVDGTPAANDYPGSLRFSVNLDGASSKTDVWTMDSGGDFVGALDASQITLGATPDTFISRWEAGELRVGATTDNNDGVLNVSGGGTATALKVGLGSATTPAITFGDSDTGIYTDNIGKDLHFVRQGASKVEVDGTGILFKASPRLQDGIPLIHGTGGDIRVIGELVSGIVDNTATTVATITTGAGDYGHVILKYGIYFAVSGEVCQEGGTVQIVFANDATSGRSAGAAGEVSVQNNTAGESLTTTWTIDTSADAMLLKVQANATMDGGSPGTATIRLTVEHSGDVSVVIP